jgi:hypothetical protein
MCRMTETSLRAQGAICHPGRYMVCRGLITEREMYIPVKRGSLPDLAFRPLYIIRIKYKYKVFKYFGQPSRA